MEKVYITGHRNPDLDSVCASYTYAQLKNKTDKNYEYVGIRCGHLSETVKSQLSAVGLTPVPYMRDVYPKVKDIMLKDSDHYEASDPVYKLVKTFEPSKPSVVSVFEKGKFLGLLSVDDISSWFLRDNADAIPLYTFTSDNIASVLPGRFIQKGKDSFKAPLLAGAADIEAFTNAVKARPDSVIVMGHRSDHIAKAVKLGVPAIILTLSSDVNEIDFSAYKGSVYVTELGTAEALRRLRMAEPVENIMGKQGPALETETLFDDAKNALASSNCRGLSVFDGGNYVGFVTRRCFLTKPKFNVIMVDHNEVSQSIKGIECACVKEIIDHHRLDALKTDSPIFIDSEPLGSTCSIVYQQFLRHSVVPDELTAKYLLTGIISDTVLLKSPTTTQTDRSSAGALAALCGIFDLKSFGEKLFSCSQSPASRDPESAIRSDFKLYTEHGITIGIGQCETTTLKDVDTYTGKYLASLEEIKNRERLDWTMVMITDVLREKSILLVSDYSLNSKLPYTKLADGVYDMPGILSRKKQLLPEIIHLMD